MVLELAVILEIQELLLTEDAVKPTDETPLLVTTSCPMRLPGVDERAAKLKVDGATFNCCCALATLRVTATSVGNPLPSIT